MESIKQIQENVQTNFTKFQNEQLSRTKEMIFCTSYKIHFYSSMLDYFYDSTEELEQKVLDYLVKLDTKILDELYDEFIDREYALIHDYSNITWFLEEYSRNQYGG